MKFLKRHRSKIMTWLGIAAPVVAGLVSGGVLTAPVIISAAGVLLAKLAASPINHDEERAADRQARDARIAKRYRRELEP